jgi:hypothetical protein
MSEDEKASLIIGTLILLAFGVFVGVVHLGARPSAVGGVPQDNTLTAWPDDRRGAGTTAYSGGTAGLGLTLQLGANNPDLIADSGDGALPLSWGRHGYRYPSASGEVLEALMCGPHIIRPALNRQEKKWLYMPPSRMGVDSDG